MYNILGKGLKIEFNLEHLLWSEMDSQTIDLGLRNTALLGEQSRIPYNWDDTWNYGVGGTLSFASNWHARLGYQFVESPVPDDALSPSLPDSDRHVVGLGAGYANGTHSIDVAWDINVMDDRRIEDNLNPAYNGKYEFNADLFGLSYTYAF